MGINTWGLNHTVVAGAIEFVKDGEPLGLWHNSDRMGFHDGNLTFRFVLEIGALVGLYRLGSHLGSGGWQFGLAVGFTLAGLLVWPTYRVPGDASAKGNAPLPVSGKARLLIELAIFGCGAWGWFLAGPAWFAWTYLGALVLHHALSYDRIGWLLRVDSTGQPPFPQS